MARQHNDELVEPSTRSGSGGTSCPWLAQSSTFENLPLDASRPINDSNLENVLYSLGSDSDVPDQPEDDSSACIKPPSDASKRRRVSVGDISFGTLSSISSVTQEAGEFIAFMRMKYQCLKEGEKLVFTHAELSKYFVNHHVDDQH